MSGFVVEENVPLAPHTTFKVGGSARYFAKVTTRRALIELLAFAKEQKWPVFILAGGSNLIVSSTGFAGLVIHLDIRSHAIEGNVLCSGASTTMKQLVDASIEAGLAGLEWAGGLPGTLGGAIRGNAGAFGGEMKDVVQSVTAIDITTGRETTRLAKDCAFEYRGSLFKHHPEIIVSATIVLRPGQKAELRAAADGHIRYRQEKHPMDLANAGSVFKNTPVEKIPAKTLPHFEGSIKTDPFPVVPTAKIIADAGLQGLRVGDAQVSEKHTNYIVNLGNATGEEIVELIGQVKAAVKKKFGIMLEIEPELVGFAD